MATKPIQISDDIAAKCDGPDQFEAFDAAFKKVIALSPEDCQRVREIKPKQLGINKTADAD